MVTTFGYRWDATLPADLPNPLGRASVFRPLMADPSKWMSNSLLSSQYTFLGIDCIETGSDGTLSGELRDPSVGLATWGPPPANCALLVTKQSTRGGRKGRGRMFVPPGYVNETDVSAAGVIASASVSTLQTKLNTFLSDLTAAGFPMFLLHDDVTLAPSQVTALSVSPLMATQRRRMR